MCVCVLIYRKGVDYLCNYITDSKEVYLHHYIITNSADLTHPHKYMTKHVAQQWELGQGKGVARGNPGLIIQSLDDYTSNWYSIYKLDYILYATLIAKNMQKTILLPRLVTVHKIAYS